MLATESMHLTFLQQKPTVNVTETESVKRHIEYARIYVTEDINVHCYTYISRFFCYQLHICKV